jgi:NADPH-dependent glutamate synthase beta subunit-like oxidoreductase/NAD-dependent dihydropyrimidine dehydrogenase PreA subunit
VGGKIASVVPESRLPAEVAAKEMERVQQMIPHVHLQQELRCEDIEQLKADFEFIVIATGAQRPRTLPVPGNEKMITALDFLSRSKTGEVRPGKRVVIIGAGNVGCDAATEAHRYGATEITLIDIQEPASFGKEREDAEAVGAAFRWPVFTEKITDDGVVLTDGEVIPADTVIVAIGDAPDLTYLPETVDVKNGFIDVDEQYQTTDPRIYAIGDVVKPGLLTDAIGSGRKAALAIIDRIKGEDYRLEPLEMIDRQRIKLEYFDPRITDFADVDECGSQCSSCGACRDCGTCVSVCPETAISKIELEYNAFEYVVDENRCIGCGFCAGACPCGIWDMKENEPIG